VRPEQTPWVLNRLAAVELVDAHLCAEPGKFLAALLLSLGSMLHLELPHVNVLSKADLVEAYGELRFNLDFYTEVSYYPFASLSCTCGRFEQPCNLSIEQSPATLLV
jgi:hypothetical protein